MLFTQKLKDETYAPWKKHYIAYDQLKKQLKESAAAENDWTEDDESRFVQLLDRELDKVYGFETSKYDEISNQLSSLEKRLDSLDVSVSKAATLESDLEKILDVATQLDRFRRLNYTGFVKLVRKHDRIHTQYRLMPLLHARFRSVPFHSEDYSPLLRRLGHIYAKIDERQDAKSATATYFPARSQKLGSDKEFRPSGYVTLQFWVHPDNLMEVKTRILRKLPVLVYNREDDDDERERDPIVTSLYLDNTHFELYQKLLERQPASTTASNGSSSEDEDAQGNSLRFRWYGKLYERPEIVLERHNEFTGKITRVNIKEKQINKFLKGDTTIVDKQVRKMRDRHVQPQAIEDYSASASDLEKFVLNNKLEPMFRTVYRRTAFEIPGDDRVRVILDQNIVFIREDSLSRTRPIRDSSSWHRGDLDRPDVDPMSMLRKGEFARFPYSVLEVRLRTGDQSKVGSLPWVDELEKSHLIKHVPHFTKFLQGVAVLYGDDERLDTLPFWLSDIDPKHSADSDPNTQGYTPNSASSSRIHESTDPESGSKAASSSGRANSTSMSARLRNYKFDYGDDEDEFDSDDSGVDPAVNAVQTELSLDHGNDVGFPTRVGKLSDEESEDDEVVLPPGVERPGEWLKNQSAPRVEAKVWLANERTFNKWLNVTCLMSALTFSLYNSVSSATSTSTATSVAYVLFGLTIFCGLWGYYQYILRIKYIKERGNTPMDAPLGPILVSIGLLLALVVNFLALYSNKEYKEVHVFSLRLSNTFGKPVST